MTGLLKLLHYRYVKFGAANSQDLARKWLLSKVNDLRVNRAALLRTPGLKTTTIIGKMYFYYYNPKTKETLPFYDRFPLVMPIELYSDGSWLGLNLHYISPELRLSLLDKLSEYKTNTKYDATTKLRLSYQLLQGAKRFRLAKPCLKRYLPGHVQSKFLEIPADEWDIACVLPSEFFMKTSKQQVWTDSKVKSQW